MSSIGRPVDVRYPTNLAIAIIVAAILVLGLAYQYTWGDAQWAWAVRVALGAFFGWAIGREVDPDNPLSAFVAAALVVGVSSHALPALLFSFWLLLALRVLNRTPGTPAQRDIAIIIALAWFLAWQGVWAAPILTAAALLADSYLPNSEDRLKLAGIAVLGAALAWPFDWQWNIHWFQLAAGAGILLVLLSRNITSDDDRGNPLDAKRVQAAQLLACLAVLVQPVMALAAGAALVGGLAWNIGSYWSKGN